jgi:hypothetical protein
MAYPFHGEMLSAFAALGNGGQVVVVIPKLSVVFACVAGNYSDSVFRSIQRDWIPNYVLPMIERSAK